MRLLILHVYIEVLDENEMVVLRRTKWAMVRVICRVKRIVKWKSNKFVDMLRAEKTLNKMAKANGVQ